MFDDKQDVSSSSNKKKKRKIIESDSEDQDQSISVIENNVNNSKSQVKYPLIDEFVKPSRLPQNNNKSKVDYKNKNAEGSSKYLKLNDSIEVQTTRKAEEMAKKSDTNSAEISKEEVDVNFSHINKQKYKL